MALGSLLLGIWLVVTGLMAFVSFNFPSRDKVMAVIALLAGFFILIGR